MSLCAVIFEQEGYLQLGKVDKNTPFLVQKLCQNIHDSVKREQISKFYANVIWPLINSTSVAFPQIFPWAQRKYQLLNM